MHLCVGCGGHYYIKAFSNICGVRKRLGRFHGDLGFVDTGVKQAGDGSYWCQRFGPDDVLIVSLPLEQFPRNCSTGGPYFSGSVDDITFLTTSNNHMADDISKVFLQMNTVRFKVSSDTSFSYVGYLVSKRQREHYIHHEQPSYIFS